MPSSARIASLLALAALAGCASITDVPPGSTLAEVEARHGRPNYSCELPDGRQRVIWSMQPVGQYAWAANVSADGRIDAVEAILTDAYFKRLHAGMTTETLLCTYGPPAIAGQAGLGEMRREVWSYRYREAKAWNSLMHVYLDGEGRVERFHPGPDPMFDEEPRFGM